MDFISKTMGNAELSDIFEIPPSLYNRSVQVIILPVEDNSSDEPKLEKRRLGFLKDKIPPLPDSFFDSLPNGDLNFNWIR